METAVTKKSITDLQSVFGDGPLRAVITEATASKAFQRFVSDRARRKLLEECIARNTSNSRRAIKNLPKPVPVLAQDIKKIPLHLLPEELLEFSLHHHFTSNHPEMLRDALSRVGQASDKNGNVKKFTEIDAKFKTAAALRELAENLAARYGVTRVGQYFAAASFCDPGLSFFFDAIAYLPNMGAVANGVAKRASDLSITDAPDTNAGKDISQQEPEDESPDLTMDPLWNASIGLSKRLNDLSGQLAKGVVSDPSEAIEVWKGLFTEVDSLRSLEGLSASSSIFELRSATAERLRRDDLLLLQRASYLRPVGDSAGTVEAVREITQMASILGNQLATQEVEKVDYELVRILRRIVAFIEDRQTSGLSQNLAEVSDLQATIATAFGTLPALAVVTGHVTIGAPDEKEQIANVENIGDGVPMDRVGADDSGDETTTESAEIVALDGSEMEGESSTACNESLTSEFEQQKADAAAVDITASLDADLKSGQSTENGIDDAQLKVSVPSGHENSGNSVREIELSSDCVGYSDFRTDHWINADGVVELAPWVNRRAHARALNEFSERVLSSKSLATAYISQLAVEMLSETPTIPSQLISDVADILSGDPVQECQVSRLAMLNGDVVQFHRSTRKLALTVEALLPANDIWAYRENIPTVLHAAQFSHPLITRIISALVNDAVEGSGTRALARRQISAASRASGRTHNSAAQFVAELKDSLESLGTVARRLRAEHCREAWRAFLRSGVESSIRAIIKTPSDALRPGPIALAEQQLRQSALQSFDDAGAKFEDRTRMDRAVQQVQQKLAALRQFLEDLHASDGSSEALSRFDFPSLDEIKKLASFEFSDPIEALCRDLLFSLSPRTQRVDPMLLRETDLMRWPALALHLGLDEPVSIQDFEFDARKVGSPVEASAVLLTPPFETTDGSDVAQTIKEHIFAVRRLDVMSMYLAEQSLNSAERSRLQRQLRAEGVDRADDAFRRLNEAWFQCESVGAPIANKMSSRIGEARAMLDQAEDATFSEALMLTAWVEHLREISERQTRLCADAIRAKVAQRNPELLEYIDGAIAERRYWELPLALDGIPSSLRQQYSTHSSRWTPWRERGEGANVRVREQLRALIDQVDEAPAKFLDAWLSDADAEESRRQLRRMFFDFASGDMSPLAKPLRRSRKDAPFDREIKQKRIVIDCRSVLLMLEEQGTNPSFVPQFHSFTSIVILSAPKATAVTSTNAAVLARWINSEVHGETQASSSSVIALVLAPGISTAMRNQIMDEFQRRQNAFVGIIVDDFDVMRMFGEQDAPPADIRPLLEIVVEQFSLSNAKSSPYSSQDGQHIRREMYVGRAGDAEALALSSRYTRVFSGRKLGKSAFLKSVADKYDGGVLPSGNRLSVLFVSIAGGDSDSYICDRITKELSVRFNVGPLNFNGRKSVADRLIGLIEYIIQNNTKVNILLLLDEADAFVEEQLRQYDREREKCLSFRLMKEVTQHVDAAELPRVRVVLSGYRVTNTRDGAWANAGEVLILPPLAQEEASKLIVTPLARLGIDAHAQADFIARRCGNQPAIINKLGDTLLKNLRDSSPNLRKEVLRLANAHVVTAFNDPSIADEVRTVMFNNFQGNPVGQIVFAAMLLAFSKLAPGFELPDAEDAVLTQIKAIDADLGWLEQRDPSMTGEIERQLNDFQDRKLVRRSETRGSVLYRLQVSHSLPILLAGDLPGQIKRAIHTLRGVHGYAIQPIRGVLSDAQIDAIKSASSTAGSPPLIVVTGSWVSALNDPRVGVADRIGISPSDTHDGSSAVKYGTVKAVLNASAAFVESVVGRREQVVLVTGGIDVARRVMLNRWDQSGTICWQSLSRVSAFGVRWWFERVRSYNFSASDGIERIISMTGCIPVLLQIVDRVMIDSLREEADVSNVQFSAIEEKIVSEISQSAHLLVSGPMDVRLEKREIEVLKMLCEMARELGRISLDDEFNEEYWVLAMDGKRPDFSPPRPSDSAVVELLIKIGLIKSEGGFLVYRANSPDPIFAIADDL
ncbi:hypothetical protein C7401_11993 [Paraburkholderia unamae]|uniref:hypothetical protein n=1 Tax=Paraburkholderia unamae TaxID=219649 RepID=UPI000DC5B51E|nr:hypothetical protein [Paraburkholderia unamae]RAR56444.1 hypothetical protein C7401_11993 [Paraburkholderia unamae]